jgi:hypothetical protein
MPGLKIGYLDKLEAAVEYLAKDEHTAAAIRRLKEDLAKSPETFVWSTIELASIPRPLPACIRSAWIFVLRRDVPSGCHFHPHSVQHMLLFEGEGRSHIGGAGRRMVRYGTPGQPPDAAWSIIDRGLPHEFHPEGGDMVVISFHTCPAGELDEVSCDTGEQRHYR